MVSRLHSRLDKVEQQSAPLKAEQERLREARKCRARVLEVLKDHIEDRLSLGRYVHGEIEDEEETIKDIVELSVMYQGEAVKRYGLDEDNKFNATPEQLKEVSRDAARRIDMRFFGHALTDEEFDKVDAKWDQARADRAAGIASAESEAAEYLRQLFKRYPRRWDAKRFYNIWEGYEHSKQT